MAPIPQEGEGRKRCPNGFEICSVRGKAVKDASVVDVRPASLDFTILDGDLSNQHFRRIHLQPQ